MQCHNKKLLVKTFTEDEDQSTEYIGSHPLKLSAVWLDCALPTIHILPLLATMMPLWYFETGHTFCIDPFGP